MPSEYMDFFPNIRKKVQLQDYKPLLDENGSQRFKLTLLLPLTGTPSSDIPFWVRPSYERMDVEESPVGETDLIAELEGFTLEAFSTDTAQFPIETEAHGLDVGAEELGRRHLLLPDSTLRDFKLVRKNLDGDTFVCLKFTVTTKADAGLALWLHKYHGAQCWFSFEKPAVDPNLAAQPASAQMALGENGLAESHFGRAEEEEDPTATEDTPQHTISDEMPTQDEMRAAAVESGDGEGDKVQSIQEGKQRRPRGFGGSTGKHVN